MNTVNQLPKINANVRLAKRESGGTKKKPEKRNREVRVAAVAHWLVQGEKFMIITEMN